MYTVQVEKTVACAHQLVGSNGPCEALHGHNYRIVVIYQGEQPDQCGMLVDFTDIKKECNAILDTIDHTYLNELPQFASISPSAENIARFVYRSMAKTRFPLADIQSVQVWETPTQMASYSE
jgi:6-pyruvoyltetrahydropterin/6-carboxytetrahydropterin synthase